uniref:NADH dehydrogenase subunit 4L n=1 Tax=Pseudochoutagus curvativus TaxID=3081119 RepID=UPI002A7FE2EC|nr:NADH dehydrogenase subunit 4L [Pseudochoutagus curvativus]WOW98901.1 NADH dehydrogenase subunit 4L [Pseudochoutagus curvativus]
MLLGLMIFFSGILSLILVRKHFLLSLLSLEFMILSVLYKFLFFSIFLFWFLFFYLFFLVLGVCEGVLGLSLNVYLARYNMLDYVDYPKLC